MKKLMSRTTPLWRVMIEAMHKEVVTVSTAVLSCLLYMSVCRNPTNVNWLPELIGFMIRDALCQDRTLVLSYRCVFFVSLLPLISASVRDSNSMGFRCLGWILVKKTPSGCYFKVLNVQLDLFNRMYWKHLHDTIRLPDNSCCLSRLRHIIETFRRLRSKSISLRISQMCKLCASITIDSRILVTQ